MKKLLTVLALVLVVATSVVGGTLAVYNTSISGVIDNNVVAKEFKLDAQASESYAKDIKIAPKDTVEFAFTVTNRKDGIISEVAIDATINVIITNADGKEAIMPLNIKLQKLDGKAYVDVNDASVSGTGSFKASAAFVAGKELTVTYKVVVNWPSTADDISFAGAGFGTKIVVNVTGKQA